MCEFTPYNLAFDIYKPNCDSLFKTSLDLVYKNNDLKRANDSLRDVSSNCNNVGTLAKQPETCSTIFDNFSYVIAGIFIAAAIIAACIICRKKIKLIAIAIIAACISWCKKIKEDLPMIIFNVFALLLIVVAFVLQTAEILEDCFDSNELIALVATTTALVIGSFTIISIAISLRKEKIGGLTTDNFYSLVGFHIPLLDMVYIFFALIAVNVVAMLLGYGIASIVISTISLGYAGFFCKQELPVTEKTLWKKIKEIFTKYEIEKKDRTANKNDEEKEQKKILKNTISPLLFEKNIKKVYEKLCYGPKENEYQKNNEFLLGYLLDIQKSLEKNNIYIPITQLHEAAIENIKIILSFYENFDIVEILTKSSYSYIDIVQSLLAIINSKAKTNDINKEWVDIFTAYIFLPLAYRKDIEYKKRNFLFGIITAMLSYTVNNGKDWFLKILREYYTNEMYVINDCQNMSEFFIITCWFLYHVQKEEPPVPKDYPIPKEGYPADNTVKEMIGNFVKEFEKENSGWKELYRIITALGCSGLKSFRIKTLLDMHKINARHNGSTNIDNNILINEHLSEKSLLNWFFEMLFSSNCIYSIEPKKIFENCSDEESIRIANHLKHEWLDDNNQIKNKAPEGQIFFGSNECYIIVQENFKNLITWVNQTQGEWIRKSTEDINDDFLTKLKNEMVEKIEIEIQKSPYFNDKVDLSSELIYSPTYYCHQTQNDMYANKIIKAFIGYLPDLAKNIISIKIDREKSQVRSLTDKEINEKIDNQYKRGDGLYFYQDLNCNIFMTREEVFDIIKTKHFAMQLAFRIKEKPNVP